MNKLMIILKKELMEVFRDKKSLSMMLIIPIMIPLIILGLSALFNSEMDTDIEEYNRIGFNYELSDVEQSIAESMKIEAITKENEELKNSYANGEINLYVLKEESKYTLSGNSGDNTSYALALMEAFYASYKEYLQGEYLVTENVNADKVLNIISVEQNIEEKENYFANYITTYGFLFIIMAITVSATYPATDATAGEKERGTLETLLTFPVKAKDIILGKFFSVTISSIITGLLSLVLFIVSLKIASSCFDIYDGVDMMLPLISIIYSLVVIVAYSFLISGLCIAIASKSKTFKEAQSSLTPLTFISFFPGMIAFLIDIESSYLMSFIPFLNFTLLFDDITTGNVNVINIFLMLLSTMIIIAIVLSVIIKQYKSENVLF